MGHRVYLSKIEGNTGYSIFESNNNLPLFWLFLLDKESILKDRDYLIELFHDEEKEDGYDYNSCIHIPSETLKVNIDRALDYLKKTNSNLEGRFQDFGKFIVDGSKEGVIELDIMQLANFTDPEDFLNEICLTLGQIEEGEIIREVAYYKEHEPSFYELLGYECLEKEGYHFSDFSKEYKDFIEKESKNKKSYTKKEEPKFEIRQMLSNVLFPIITGLIFIIAGFSMIISNEGIFLPILGILFGSLAVFFGYANINFKK